MPGTSPILIKDVIGDAGAGTLATSRYTAEVDYAANHNQRADSVTLNLAPPGTAASLVVRVTAGTGSGKIAGGVKISFKPKTGGATQGDVTGLPDSLTTNDDNYTDPFTITAKTRGHMIIEILVGDDVIGKFIVRIK
jgi:hypothetical protein